MKTNRLLLVAAVAAAVFGLGNTAKAQFKLETDDGIAASPKMRQMLNDQKKIAAPPATAVAERATQPKSNIAASPKLTRYFAEHALGMKHNAAVATTPSTTAAPNDGIAASPKLRQQLNERATPVQIAPVK